MVRNECHSQGNKSQCTHYENWISTTSEKHPKSFRYYMHAKYPRKVVGIDTHKETWKSNYGHEWAIDWKHMIFDDFMHLIIIITTMMHTSRFSCTEWETDNLLWSSITWRWMRHGYTFDNFFWVAHSSPWWKRATGCSRLSTRRTHWREYRKEGGENQKSVSWQGNLSRKRICTMTELGENFKI